MQYGSDAFSWLIAPESTTTFLSDYFNKKHFWCRHEDRSRFAGLLSFADLDTVLGMYGLKYPDIRLAHLNEDLPHSEYCRGDLIDPMRVGRLYAAGATVIYRSLQHWHAPLQQFCHALAEQASIQTQANIYLTPPDSQGFKVHWDTHDVFIMQVEGSKVWRIYDGGIPIPIRSQKFDSALHEHGDVIDEFTLHAGQVLYIPRGVMHAGASTSEGSLHITLGFLGYSWAELLIDALAEHLEAHATWRENMPFGFANDPQGREKLEASFRARVQKLPEEVDIGPVIEALLLKIRNASRPREPHYMRNAISAGAITDQEVVAVPISLSTSLRCVEDRVVLLAGKSELSFPALAHPMLSQLLNKAPIKVADLDPELDLESRLNVLKKLLQEGIVKRVD